MGAEAVKYNFCYYLHAKIKSSIENFMIMSPVKSSLISTKNKSHETQDRFSIDILSKRRFWWQIPRSGWKNK
jgi:hypothetical protein